MNKLGIVLLAAVLSLSAFAFANRPTTPANDGAACVQAGIGFLQSNGLLQAAAQKQIDYSTLGPEGAGLIRVQLPENSFLSLGQVVRLHTTNPELFTWCD